MSTAIFKNINLVDTLPELRLTATGSDYMRQYRSATTNYGYQYNRVQMPSAAGSAISCPNATDAGVVGGGNNPLNGFTAVTMSQWVYVTAFTNEYAGYVASRGTSPNWINGFTSGGSFDAGKEYPLFTLNQNYGVQNPTKMNTGTWYHLVGSWTSGGTVDLYVNGVKASGSTFTGSITMTQSAPLKFGHDAYAAGRKLNGYIDEVAIWSRKLTDAEVLDLYNAGGGLYITPANNFPSTGTSQGTNLFVLHHADEGSGTTLADSSGNSRTATGKYWVAGRIRSVATTQETTIWSSKDGTNPLEKGIQTFGDVAGRTVLDGLTTRFNVAGVEKGQLSTTMAWTLPNTITGSSDAVQFKILANATQTSNIMDVFASDGTTAKFHIKGDGKVGIGTTEPGAKLEVNGNSSDVVSRLYSGNAANYAYFTVGRTADEVQFGVAGASNQFFSGTVAGTAVLKNHGSGDIWMGVGDTNPTMVLKSGGNVGIGTTAPLGQLHVKSGSTLAGTVLLERTGLTTDIAYTSMRATSTKTTNMGDGFGSLVSFSIQDDAAVVETIGSIGAVRAGTDTTGDIVFQPFTSGTANERMRIKYSGEVGIGTTAPSTKLHVLGTTEQLRLGYDASNYLSTTIGSTGSATLALTGTTPTFTFSQGVKLSTLTAGRVIFAGASGLLSDDADLTFATDTLTATKIVGATSVKVGTAAGFISSDGSTGATGTFTTVDLKTVTVKDGIITAIV